MRTFIDDTFNGVLLFAFSVMTVSFGVLVWN
jgi:hypothetical protein